ncbi:hypothetical protein ZYGR_0N05860 [Zygosaccharomyces rouxii]|uniref:ZYRO0D13750p n=2 Tax=Zygosaccharomyces rouxii TaxID=4956 RepID=C5DWC7_ZYGRC|nr:uncharacterized protein ZYRO0D13750g [Zygosaccharomyces rouxii]KAH9201006.1 nucleoporin protein Ndc1-Nup [Zygosaccharomyces rouxii]GAV49179.1 hypothetical protein ZYGR_0N05860 [Zygosaccharomyces rouxii]CAR28096.1 ZYRO0D13750p [Zygosaccharomyces rouxii]
MLDSPVPLSSRYSYHAIFSDICKTRFNHLATRLSLTLTFFQALVIVFFSSGQQSNLEWLLALPLRFFLLYLCFLLIVITRKNYLHVDFKGYSNVVKLILGQTFSISTLVYQMIYSLCCFLLSLAVSDCLGLTSMSSSHAFTQSYRLHVWVLIPTIYTLQHCLFDLDRLSFNFESHFQPPQQYIASRVRKILIKSGILSIFLAIVAPLTLASSSSYWFIGFKNNLKLLLLAFWEFANLEFVNIAFNAHMSIGCLHKGKPISSLSSTPMETLATGLSSKKQFTKLTAFQELSYRATSSDLSLRLPLYHTRYRNTHIWPVILRESLLVIQETNDTVTKYLNTLENTMSLQDSLKRRSPISFADENEKLFGNQATVTSSGSSSGIASFPGSPPTVSSNGISHRITLRDDNVLLLKNLRKQRSSASSGDLLGATHSFNEPIITHETTLLTVLIRIAQKVKESINSFFFPSAVTSQEHRPQLSIIEAWSISKKRQAETLVPLPVCHAECIISLMGLLINAIDEDPKGGVVSSVGEVLKTLERSVGALGKFADWNPDSKKKSEDEKETPDGISILYDLSISAFLEIVLKYNVLLNDVYLDDDVVKLSKWVLDMCSK